MGFFKDVRKLQKQAKEIDKTWDPGAQMAQAMQSMQAASAMMEQQTAGATVGATGDPAYAQVNMARDTGQMINMQPWVELQLLVFLEGTPPYPVTVRQVVPLAQMGRLAPGTRLNVKVDPTARESIWIDWGAL